MFKNSETINSYIKFLPFIKPYTLRALTALGLAIPIGCLDAVIALSLKPYMDIVMVEKTMQSPWYIPLLIVLFTSLQGLLNYISVYMNDWTTFKVTNDLKYAKVYVSILNSKNVKDTLAGLKKSSGYIRSELAKRVNLRNTPELIFELDDSIEYGTRIDAILKEILPEKNDNNT